ncbi:MAG: GNAT family N-acetyltransferase [Acidimicrobiia bacterium]|nr:GNAT family N-acetyltransferase [Acidimicrobiia bacterium]
MPPLRGDLISLRLVRSADIDGLIELLNDLGTRGALGHFLKSETDIRSRFERDGYWSDDSGVLLMIDAAADIVGWIGFVPVIYYFYGYEISYQVFGEQYAGKGYATEALGLLTEYLFSTKLMDRLQLSIRPDNLASLRVAEKCGYTREGVMRSLAFIEGRFHDIELWSITRQTQEAL